MAAITANAQQVIEQLERSHGNIAHAAGKLNTSRTTLHKYINERPTVAAALADIREATKDHAETMLYDRMRTSDTLLIFYLKTQARERCYGDTMALTGEGGGPVQTEIVIRYANADDNPNAA